MERKKEQIKEQENNLIELWRQLYYNYYCQRINESYTQSIKNIKECYNSNEGQCIERQLKKQERAITNLEKVFNSFHNGFEDCIFNCKYSLQLEIEDCYVECFQKTQAIIKKLHNLN